MNEYKMTLELTDKAAAVRGTDRKGLIALFYELDPDYARALEAVIQKAEEALRDPGQDCETASE